MNESSRPAPALPPRASLRGAGRRNKPVLITLGPEHQERLAELAEAWDMTRSGVVQYLLLLDLPNPRDLAPAAPARRSRR